MGKGSDFRALLLIVAWGLAAALGVARDGLAPGLVRGRRRRPEDPAARDLKPLRPPADTAPTTTVDIPRSYALVIGGAHDPNLSNRRSCSSRCGMRTMYATLISPEGGQFPPEHVRKLINEQVTLANLKREPEQWLPSVTQPNDRVMIYFAGHGFISGGKAYLAPSDIDLKNIAQTAYPMSTLGDVVGTRIKGKWKVLITDACHSGAITPEDDPAAVNKNLLDLHSSLLSLTASRDREQSFESAEWGGGHGILPTTW